MKQNESAPLLTSEFLRAISLKTIATAIKQIDEGTYGTNSNYTDFSALRAQLVAALGSNGSSSKPKPRGLNKKKMFNPDVRYPFVETRKRRVARRHRIAKLSEHDLGH